MGRHISFCVVALLCAASAALAQAPDGERPRGYVAPANALDDALILPPPPADESLAGEADRQAFLSTRAFEGSRRWDLAAHDAAADQASLIDDFSCAVGARLDLEQLPETGRLLARAMADAGASVGAAKNRYNRSRPFVVMEGPVCTDSSYLANNGSYPSGHATGGWMYALVLTQLAPDRASEILSRGRVYGESRVVCGVHYPSDVEGGRLVATAVFALLQSSPEYQADLRAARTELDALRAAAPAPDPERCVVEAEAAGASSW